MSIPVARAPHPALAAWSALRAQASGRGALVTLVRTDGGSSKPVGAHLALAEDGRAYGSVTIGGCADGRALAGAAEVLRSGVRERITVPLSEDDALALGLGCAGDVELLIERVGFDAHDPLRESLDAAAAALERGVRGVLVTPLGTVPGRLFVADDGARAGATGDGIRDRAAAELALKALRDGEAAVGVHEAVDEQWLVQLLTPVRTILIVGATEIAAALCQLMAPLGWRSVLIDPRDELLAEPRFASATEHHAALPAELVASRLGGASTAVVLVAHDYKVELPVLRVALRAETPYVGMLGSRKRGTAVRAMLAEDGLSAAEIDRLRTPIGLPIGAQGAAEIAVSIVAELVAHWRGVK
ncbi:MAG TPA: XdhC family protein [Gemmatimonadaceae bacterium]|nr:XdhC family protein [Gemmatimonadaceae bacterium]